MQFIDLQTQQKRIRQQLQDRINAVLDHGQYIMGPEVAELEEKLQEYLDVPQAIAVSSGTDALLIALMALDIGPGDEVVTVPYTWISTAEVIAFLGAKTVFVDIDERTWNMDPAQLSGAITDKTRAIIPVGIYGQASDMREINRIAEEAGGIPVIEDAAQSFGAVQHGKRSGALANISCTSFFPSKPLGCYGDGGAIFSFDGELAEKMRWIRNHGQQKKHYHPVIGLNGRLDSLQAAILLEKMKIFDEEISLRQEVAERYGQLLKDRGVTLPFVAEGNTSVFAQYTVLSSQREQIQAALGEADIPSVSYYTVPLHLQPVFSGLGHGEGDFPVTEKVSRECLSLPMSPYLTPDEQAKVAAAFPSF